LEKRRAALARRTFSMTQTTAGNIGQLCDVEWLVSEAATHWLELAAGFGQSLAAQVAQLRRQLSPERTHLVLEQVVLRERARVKFSAAERMFFTPRGLEQATDEMVARYKGGRFAANARIFDLCTGIGGDLIALAHRGEAVGFDRDPIVATIAAANASLDGRMTPVRLSDVGSLDMTQCDAWHIDPDRRPGGRRTTLVDLHEPGPDAIERLLGLNPHAAIKLAPAAQLPASWGERAELEWISRGRECRQLVAWFGGLAGQAGRRRATILGATSREARTIVGMPEVELPLAEDIKRYLFEPDAAVLAAKLSGALAAEHDLAGLAPGLAYWTGDRAIADPALACFEVQETLPFRTKPLKALLRARDIGQLEIKKRGVDLDPAELRRQLDLSGLASATLLIARIAKRETAILAQRIPQ
jgi:hypothetical protein